MTAALSLDTYRLLGRSGLRVSPLSLGTTGFGASWGSDADTSRKIFDNYVDRGGNFVDTAVTYADGAAERLVGAFMKGKRDRIIVGTKFSHAREPGNPNSGGNHRLNMIRSVETSLRQLDTQWIDLLYLHNWDFTTAPDEIIRGLDDLVRSGKVVYVGISNAPAWRVAQMQTVADLRGWSPLVALQIEYNLVQRTAEHELIPMAVALGLGILPWSPLASGLLGGKYDRGEITAQDPKRADASSSRRAIMAMSGNLTEKSFTIVDAVREVAGEMGVSCSQVALAWVLQSPAIVSPIFGARTLDQFEDNLGALSVRLSEDHRCRLGSASAPETIFPYGFVGHPSVRRILSGGANIETRR